MKKSVAWASLRRIISIAVMLNPSSRIALIISPVNPSDIINKNKSIRFKTRIKIRIYKKKK